jgi:hypothetical protein
MYSLEVFPLSYWPQLPMSIFIQLSHCLVVLCRLNCFECANLPWDRKSIRQKLDLGKLLRCWGDRFASVPEAVGMDMTNENGESPWSHTPNTIAVISKWGDAKLAAMLAAEAKGGTQFEAIDFSAVNVDGMDDVWMRDMLGEAGYDFLTDPMTF